MDSQFITDKTREAQEAVRKVLDKFKEETGLCVQEINIDLIDAGSKLGNNFLVGKIKFKLIA